MRWMSIVAGLLGIAALAVSVDRAPGARRVRDADAAIVVTVNGAAVSARQLRARAADRASFAQFEARLIEHEIADQLVQQEAARRRIAMSDAEERALDGRMPPAGLLAAQAAGLGLDAGELAARRRGAMRAQVLARKLVEQDFPAEVSPSEAELRRAFAELPEAYAEPPAATVRAFLVPLSAEADDDQVEGATRRAEQLIAAARRVDSPEAFSRLAATQGTIPPGTPDGVLGTLTFTDAFAAPVPALFGPALSPEVTLALFPARPESAEPVAGPFRGPQGVFGLFIEGRRPRGPAPAFEQVRAQVRERWIARALLVLTPRLIQRLRATATIESNQGVTAS